MATDTPSIRAFFGTAPEVTAHVRNLELLCDRAREANQTVVAALEQSGDVVRYLHAALEESVKLQSHYAALLNVHDGGQRMTFNDAAAWLERLAGVDGRSSGR